MKRTTAFYGATSILALTCFSGIFVTSYEFIQWTFIGLTLVYVATMLLGLMGMLKGLHPLDPTRL